MDRDFALAEARDSIGRAVLCLTGMFEQLHDNSVHPAIAWLNMRAFHHWAHTHLDDAIEFMERASVASDRPTLDHERSDEMRARDAGVEP